MATGWSLLSDLAGRYTAIAAQPDGLALRGSLATDTELSYRPIYSAATVNGPVVIVEFEATGSPRNQLG